MDAQVALVASDLVLEAIFVVVALVVLALEAMCVVVQPLVRIRCEAMVLALVPIRCEAMVLHLARISSEAMVLHLAKIRCVEAVRPHVLISSEAETVVIVRVVLMALLAGRKPVGWVHRAMPPLKAWCSALVEPPLPL